METPFNGVSFGERLAFQNVVSTRTKFHYSELAERFDAFVSAVTVAGGQPKGPLFYSLNNVPMDAMVDIELFLSIQQSTFSSGEGFRFSSYFEVSPMLRGIVKGDFANQTEVVYAQLLAALEAEGLAINSPFFHVLQKDVSPYALVYLGYVGAVAESITP
jgi:hypothetical protein